MPRFRMILARSLAVLTLAMFLLPSVAGPGRNVSRCNRACNEAERLCKDPCFSICQGLFPGDDVAIGACTGECNAFCRDTKHECKVKCRAERDGETPTEP